MIIFIVFLIALFCFFSLKINCMVIILFSVLLLYIIMFPIYYRLFFMEFYTDSLSFFLIYLTLLVIVLINTSRITLFKLNLDPHLLIKCFIILVFSLIVSFSVASVLMFYFFFEFSLIPTILLIIGWGYQVERVQASVYFLLYTIAASLPLLVRLLYINQQKGTFLFYYSLSAIEEFNSLIPARINLLFSLFISLALLVKLPIYFFHLWLPKAHVEAPVSGSIILAGVLLKLGGYGILRLYYIYSTSLIKLIFRLSCISIVYIGLTCCRSNDIKSLIAYSSVSHMAITMSGISTSLMYGLRGGLLILIGHGVCSSGIFYYINIIYERSSRRRIFFNKGLIRIIVGRSMLRFLICIANIAAPPTINLFSEIFLIFRITSFCLVRIPFFLAGSFLVACFTIYFFSFSHQGKFNSKIRLIPNLRCCEFLNIYTHIVPLFLSFMFINIIS